MKQEQNIICFKAFVALLSICFIIIVFYFAITKKNSFILLLFLYFGAVMAHAQELSNARSRQLVCISDTIQLDSLSIIPNTIKILDNEGKPIDSSLFRINYPSSQLILSKSFRLQHNIVSIAYKVFPYAFSQVFYHKDYRKMDQDMTGNSNPFIYTYNDKSADIFKTEGLNKNGSISRGISFGNNQDVIMNSSLNLQLSGKLSEEVSILAAITDNNIPIQPDGNTQQIQEFDKVFIQVYNKSSKLIAGDFELVRPQSYFMNFYKKAQGGIFNTSFLLNPKEKDKTKQTRVTAAASAAISKGKYARNTLSVIEGNQGPYKLTGSNNELYIVVLAGTEKVYVDGQMLSRGQDNDYVIDYNTAEITFTPKMIITKDKRIVVEFEYSDKNYVRSLFYTGEEFEKNKVKVRVNFYSEQDSKNQPIQQSLTDEQKLLLAHIGDSLNLAITHNIDSIAFTNNEVLYKKIDTIVNTILYDSVFVYSTNADSAHYRLGFSNVGQGNGNYVQIQSSANGRVYKWIPPVSGVKQGLYEPVAVLVTPKKKQMLTVATDYKISKNTFASVEAAMSNNDLNTFSKYNDRDNVGYATKVNITNKTLLSKSDTNGWALSSALMNEWTGKEFTYIERYREVEFERDWNLNNVNIVNDENIASVKLNLSRKKTGNIGYQLSSYTKGSAYNGLQHAVNSTLHKKGFELLFDGSYLQTKGALNTTEYFKQKASLLKKFKIITIGVKEEQEQNKFKEIQTDTLQLSSFSFNEYEAFLNSADTSKNAFSLNYKKRFDYLPMHNSLHTANTGESVGASMSLIKNSNHRFILNASYRTLAINDTLLSLQKPDNSVVGRIEHYIRLLKGTFTANTFYEIGSGMEIKKEFSYLEVAQGQGVYAWTDYNGNGVKELNEFEIAAFQDQANYIRIYIPTNEYIKTYTNQFTESLNINPAAVWANKKGMKKFVSRISNQTVYRIDHKTNNIPLEEAYNPFITVVSDSTLISLNSSFRSTLFFNRSNPTYGFEFGYQDNRNKNLLTNGFDSRIQKITNVKARWNINRKVAVTATYNNGNKQSSSDYFSTKDFNIFYYDAEPILSIQSGTAFRISFSYKYSNKLNTLDTLRENAINQKGGVEIKYNVLTKGSLLFKANYIQIAYNATQNSSIAYEMLEGLKKGNNATWSLSYQRNISNNLQLNLIYEGRKSQGSKTIHVGSVQLRANF